MKKYVESRSEMNGCEVQALADDAEWVKRLSKMPRARVLLDHLAAFDTTICCGGVKGIEAPLEQAATWRRAFCYEFSKTDRPFNIVSSSGRKLPKCIGICQLSGKHCMYYTESVMLAKIVCLSVQELRQQIIEGIDGVLKKAEELDASVLMTFCLPFQSGLERAYWEVRTIRKTAKGAIKDGELAFASGDAQPRMVPCTRSLEHWTDTLVCEISRRLAAEATAVCLDSGDEEESRKLDPSSMESMIEMLKADRRKIIESHKAELVKVHEKHREEAQAMRARVEEAEQEASMRIAKVAQASKVAEGVMKKKEEQINAHNITLREQLVSVQQSKEVISRDLNAANLRNEEEKKKADARQKTLEAQVTSLKSNIAKTASGWVKYQNERKECDHQNKKALAKVSLLESQLNAKASALTAVEASAGEARNMLEACQESLKVSMREERRAKASLRLFKVVVKLAATRLDSAVERATTDAVFFEKEREKHEDFYKASQKMDEKRIDKLQTEISNLRESHKNEVSSLTESLTEAAKKEEVSTSTAFPEKDANGTEKLLKEAEKEIGRNKHLLSETDKRVKYLERSLKESDDEVRRLKSVIDSKPVSPNGDDKKAKEVSVKSNGVYIQPVHHPAFAQPQYNIDPQLENTISTLHSALNAITSLARSSTANGKHAEITQAKLDALTSFGVPPPQQQIFYECHQQAPPHHPQYAIYQHH